MLYLWKVSLFSTNQKSAFLHKVELFLKFNVEIYILSAYIYLGFDSKTES